MQLGGRLHYVDTLRVSAFAILIVYHASVAFFPDMSWLIESAQRSETLSLLMKFPRAWRLALLFFVSGMGTWFAFSASPHLGFLRDRFVRLLVPLLFAMCVIVVPQVWYERIYEDGYHGSLLAFWVERYFSEGKYPEGQFTWAHMWFVAYLLAMTVACYPIFRRLVDPRLRRLNAWFEAAARSNGVYLFFLLPLVLNLALSPIFPRQTNALYNDGAWFAVWASWFGLGFLFARHHRALIGTIVERRWLSAAIALFLTTGLYKHSWGQPGGVLGGYDEMTPLYKAMIFALAWSMILGLTGFAALHLNRRIPAVAWLNGKIFPLYIVHQTVLVAALYHILPLEAGVGAKFALALVATAVGSLIFCLVIERLPWPWRALVGLTEQPRSSVAPAAARAAQR